MSDAGAHGPPGADPPPPGLSLDAPALSELTRHAIDPPSVKLLSDGFCRKKHVVILGQVDPEGHEPITVGMLDPEDRELARRLQGFLHRPINPVRLDAHEIVKALDIGHGRTTPSTEQASFELHTGSPAGSPAEQAAQAVIGQLLQRAIELQASALHIEHHPGHTREQITVRVRIDGTLHRLPTPLTPEDIEAVVARLTILAGPPAAPPAAVTGEGADRHDGPTTRGSLRGSYGPPEQRRTVDVRLALGRGPDGVDVTLRLRGHDTRRLSLSALGLPPDLVPRVDGMLRGPEGLVLVTGPVGHGRTTTLYSLLDALAGRGRKILSVEDPVEHRIEGTSQRATSPTVGFAAHVHAFVDQDPDVIAIGNIADEATVQAAAMAVEAGCLVLAAGSMGDTAGALTHLSRLGLAPDQVAEIMRGVLAQRLLRRICESCRELAPDDAIAESVFTRLGRRFAHMRGRGCARCHGTGHRGRIAIFELLEIDRTIAECIVGHLATESLRRHARAAGMRTLAQAALLWAEQGELSLEEMCGSLSPRLMRSVFEP
ncbi:MAG: ATPase, T2SS/T4P/T4SS family [Myxococcota bacterium]